ncbi:MAG: T9SS type A sorting domain-containing protein, partial [Muribaculaceae bacterium]
ASLEALPDDLSERHWVYNYYVRYWPGKDEQRLKLVTLDITQHAGGTGIESVEVDDDESELSVYPTVANSVVNIYMPQMRRIEVYNLCGSKVGDYALSGNIYEMNVSDLNSGVYIILVHSDKGIRTARFVKK